MISRYQSNPRLEHLVVVKHILKCLRRIRNYIFLYFGKELDAIRYTDLGFKSNKDFRKSNFDSVFTLGKRAIIWRSIKQSCIADSTMEAEYVLACEAAKEAV